MGGFLCEVGPVLIHPPVKMKAQGFTPSFARTPEAGSSPCLPAVADAKDGDGPLPPLHPVVEQISGAAERNG
ncbi:hypothetical protein GCM10008174_01570 [Methylopila turkensis]|uniref:Uncharacterized protein n=1 Tax=Methylopila turkensis TaxID=1437816 RepID=A0A9W6N5M9_9HYPH|nr:hypothetical protein GCM10008174_01570 [Methylopila turkensis]